MHSLQDARQYFYPPITAQSRCFPLQRESGGFVWVHQLDGDAVGVRADARTVGAGGHCTLDPQTGLAGLGLGQAVVGGVHGEHFLLCKAEDANAF